MDYLDRELVRLKKQLIRGISEKIYSALRNLREKEPDRVQLGYSDTYEGTGAFYVKYIPISTEEPISISIIIIPWIFPIKNSILLGCYTSVSHHEIRTILDYVGRNMKTDFKIVFIENEPYTSLINYLNTIKPNIIIFGREKKSTHCI